MHTFNTDTQHISDILNFTEESGNQNLSSSACTFQEIICPTGLLTLVWNANCYRHTFLFSLLLFLSNLCIFLFGLFGNSVVIYVVVYRLKRRTVSNIFILNLAIADLLVITCCIPATTISNLFTPWIFSQWTCKLVAFAQGLSVICSVYSLVAISFDRCRALHPLLGISPNITTSRAYLFVLLIWIIGSVLTLPWAFVFHLIHYNPEQSDVSCPGTLFPFCVEGWQSDFLESGYFLVVHVGACFVIPFLLITVCNVLIWKSVLEAGRMPLTSSDFQKTQHKRKLRILRIFTALNCGFFLFWLPLYVIMARVKIFRESEYETELYPVLVPIAQLLGSCNSCVNPVLYAFLSSKVRESFKRVFSCSKCIFGSNLGSLSEIIGAEKSLVAGPIEVETQAFEMTAV